MAKKQFGKLITLAAIAGAATAAVSYLLKYKSFHKELDEDFHDFEDEFEEFGEADTSSETATRSYVSLNSDRQAETKEEDMAPDSETEEQDYCTESIEDVPEDTTIKADETAELIRSTETAESDTEASPVFTSDSTTIVEDTTE